MKSRRIALLVLLGILTATCVSAQTLPEILEAAPTGRSVDAADSRFEIQASTDETNATIKASKTVSSGQHFQTFQLSSSAPLAKGGGATEIAAWSGFPNAFTVTGKYTNYWTRGTRKTGFTKGSPPDKAADAMCGVARTRAGALGVQNTADLLCDANTISEYAPDLSFKFDSLFWDDSKSHVIWGGTATVGHRVFEFFQATNLEKDKATRTPKGASLYGAVIPFGTLMLVTAGAEYREKYKDADSETRCPAATSTDPQTCKTGSFAEPTETTQKIVFAEVRRHIASRAVSLKLTYDFETDHWSGDLPIYLIRTPAGALAGGIRAGWEEDKDWQFGVFVSSAFSLFP